LWIKTGFYPANLLNQRQLLLNIRPLILVPGRQPEFFPYFFQWLINGKTGVIGSNFKQYTARFAEVHRIKIIAVNLLSD